MRRTAGAVLRAALRIPARLNLPLNVAVEVAMHLAQQQQDAVAAYWDVPKFQLLAQCLTPPPTPDWQGNSGTVGCLTLQAGGLTLPSGVGATITRVHIARKDQSFGTRWRTVYLWGRVDAGTTTPVFVPAVPEKLAQRLPERFLTAVPWEQADPFSVPVGVPQHTPRPLPVKLLAKRRDLNLWRSPTEQPTRGYQPTLQPPPPVPPRDTTEGELPRPPAKGTRERKWKAPKALSVALQVALAATEVIDWIDAVYRALPYKLRRKVLMGQPLRSSGYHRQPTPIQKALVIFGNLDDVNLTKALRNLIMEAAIDQAIGRASSYGEAWVKRNSPYTNTLHGQVSSGPFWW